MRTESSAFGPSWRSSAARSRTQGDFTAVCLFVGVGLSLTALFCAIGYGESMGQALAIFG